MGCGYGSQGAVMSDYICGLGITLAQLRGCTPLAQLQGWLAWSLLRLEPGCDLEPFFALTGSDSAEIGDVAQALYHSLMGVREAKLGEGDYFAEAERVLLVYGGRGLDDVRAKEAEALRQEGDAYAEQMADALARAVDLRTTLWLRQMEAVLSETAPRSARVWRTVSTMAAAGGEVARTLLHNREGKAPPEAVVAVTLRLAQAVWVALGVFVGVKPGAFAALVANELRRAREKFPRNTLRLAALTEEVGEFEIGRAHV